MHYDGDDYLGISSTLRRPVDSPEPEFAVGERVTDDNYGEGKSGTVTEVILRKYSVSYKVEWDQHIEEVSEFELYSVDDIEKLEDPVESQVEEEELT